VANAIKVTNRRTLTFMVRPVGLLSARLGIGPIATQRRPKYPAMNKTMTTRPTSQMILFTRLLLCVCVLKM